MKYIHIRKLSGLTTALMIAAALLHPYSDNDLIYAATKNKGYTAIRISDRYSHTILFSGRL